MNPLIQLQLLQNGFIFGAPPEAAPASKPEDWKKSNGGVPLPTIVLEKNGTRKWPIKPDKHQTMLIAGGTLVGVGVAAGGDDVKDQRMRSRFPTIAIDQPGTEIKLTPKGIEAYGKAVDAEMFDRIKKLVIHGHLLGNIINLKEAAFADNKEDVVVKINEGSSVVQFGPKTAKIELRVAIDDRQPKYKDEKDKELSPVIRVRMPQSLLKDATFTIDPTSKYGELTAGANKVAITDGQDPVDIIIVVTDDKDKEIGVVPLYKKGKLADTPEKIQELLKKAAQGSMEQKNQPPAPQKQSQMR